MYSYIIKCHSTNIPKVNCGYIEKEIASTAIEFESSHISNNWHPAGFLKKNEYVNEKLKKWMDSQLWHLMSHVELLDKLSNHKSHSAKHLIDRYSRNNLWDKTKILTNPYEFIYFTSRKYLPIEITPIANIDPLSRSFFKMIEMANTGLTTQIESIKPLITLHLAEGPGGFIEAIIYKRYMASINSQLYTGYSLATHNHNYNLDASIDTNMDTNLDTNLAANIATNLDTRIDSNLAANMDTNLDTNMYSNLDASIDTRIDTIIDSNLAANMDANLAANMDTNLDANIDTRIDNKIDTKIDTRVDTRVAASIDMNIDKIQNINIDNDRHYAITLLDNNKFEIPSWRKSQKFISANPHLNILTGVDGTGNLYNTATLRSLHDKFVISDKYGNQHRPIIVTGDGGFDFSVNHGLQEYTASRLILAQVLAAMLTLKKSDKSVFICKFFDMHLRITMEILYLLQCRFQRVFIYKPNTSRMANSEKYIICEGYNGVSDMDDNRLQYLQPYLDVLDEWNKLESENTKTMLDATNHNCDKSTQSGYRIRIINNIMDHNTLPIGFIKFINTINNKIIEKQRHNIMYTVNIIEGRDNLPHNWCQRMIDIAIKWCHNNNIPISKKYTIDV